MAKENKASAHVLDFSNVSEGGGGFRPTRLPEGDYVANILSVTETQAKDGTPMWLYAIEVKAQTKAGGVLTGIYRYYCKLQENQLWKVRNLLVAAGFNPPKSKQKVDPTRVVGRQVGVRLQDDEYEGREQSSIEMIFAASEVEGNEPVVEDEDEVTEVESVDEPKKGKKGKKDKKKPVDSLPLSED